jgi:hypothetical protein
MKKGFEWLKNLGDDIGKWISDRSGGHRRSSTSSLPA